MEAIAIVIIASILVMLLAYTILLSIRVEELEITIDRLIREQKQ